jgi:hypothetical protein
MDRRTFLGGVGASLSSSVATAVAERTATDPRTAEPDLFTRGSGWYVLLVRGSVTATERGTDAPTFETTPGYTYAHGAVSRWSREPDELFVEGDVVTFETFGGLELVSPVAGVLDPEEYSSTRPMAQFLVCDPGDAAPGDRAGGFRLYTEGTVVNEAAFYTHDHGDGTYVFGTDVGRDRPLLVEGDVDGLSVDETATLRRFDGDPVESTAYPEPSHDVSLTRIDTLGESGGYKLSAEYVASPDVHTAPDPVSVDSRSYVTGNTGAFGPHEYVTVGEVGVSTTGDLGVWSVGEGPRDPEEYPPAGTDYRQLSIRGSGTYKFTTERADGVRPRRIRPEWAPYRHPTKPYVFGTVNTSDEKLVVDGPRDAVGVAGEFRGVSTTGDVEFHSVGEGRIDLEQVPPAPEDSSALTIWQDGDGAATYEFAVDGPVRAIPETVEDGDTVEETAGATRVSGTVRGGDTDLYFVDGRVLDLDAADATAFALGEGYLDPSDPSGPRSRAPRVTRLEGSIHAGELLAHEYAPESGAPARLEVRVVAGGESATVADGESVDLDLYVTTDGRPAGPRDYDARDARPATDAAVVLSNRSVGERVGIGVRAAEADGEQPYEIVVSEWP